MHQEKDEIISFLKQLTHWLSTFSPKTLLTSVGKRYPTHTPKKIQKCQSVSITIYKTSRDEMDEVGGIDKIQKTQQ